MADDDLGDIELNEEEKVLEASMMEDDENTDTSEAPEAETTGEAPEATQDDADKIPDGLVEPASGEEGAGEGEAAAPPATRPSIAMPT